MTDERPTPSMDRSALPVLVVEDDAEVRCLLQREVADLGHPACAVSSAEQALGALGQAASAPFAVVITDIRMPGMDGVALTQAIKERSPDTEVILITGYASVETAARAVQLGASDYLTKPLGDIDRIRESLDRALGRVLERRGRQQQLDGLEAHRATLSALLERLPMAVLLLGIDEQVLMHNQAAAELLSRPGAGAGARGLLRLDPSGRLTRLVRRASRVAGDGQRQGGAANLDPLLGAQSPSALVLPLGEVARDVGQGEPAAAVFVSQPGGRTETAEGLLSRLYGLTPTEARVAAILMQGRGVEGAAAQLEVSTNTVRTHLKRVFSKTGTSRQGELISLMLSGPALLRLAPEPER